MPSSNGGAPVAIYVQSNDATANEVLAFRRAPDGRLGTVRRYATGGRGTGMPHLPSQNSVVLGDDGRQLLVANAQSDDVTLFIVRDGGLQLADRVASGGTTPTSVAIHGDLVYVLNNGSPNIAGFRIQDDRLAEIPGSVRSLSAGDADPAQVAFSSNGRTLVVTERGTDSISAYAIGEDGRSTGRSTIRSAGKTPYGFGFTPGGSLVVTEAFGGAVGAAAVSSYSVEEGASLAPVSGSVADTRSEVCWAAVTGDGRFAYVTNFGDGTVSSYAVAADGALALRDPVAGSTRLGEKGVRDEALTGDGRFLYAIDADARQVFGWAVDSDGTLDPLGAFEGLPETVAGLAAS